MRAVSILAFAIALSGCDDIARVTDTPEQHRSRLLCEMAAMDGSGGHKPMSADDAAAYCAKQMELWNGSAK